MRSFASSADAWPSTDTVPVSANRIDMISRMVVVLPAPLGPMNPYSAPRGISRSRLCSAVIAPNVLVTPVSLIAASMRHEYKGIQLLGEKEIVDRKCPFRDGGLRFRGFAAAIHR